MKRADIEVGEIYGVRLKPSERSPVVPAKVVGVDVKASWPEYRRWAGTSETVTKGGCILVEFTEPTRVGFGEFNLVADTNKHAGDIAKTYAFHESRNGKGQIGKLFVGRWDDIQAQRRAAEEHLRQQHADANARADEFEPKLAAYLSRLGALGIDVTTHADFSGIHGDVDRSISTARVSDEGYRRRPTGFSYGSVGVDSDLFEWLLQQAEATGSKWEARS
jgi:hypothetical protein